MVLVFTKHRNRNKVWLSIIALWWLFSKAHLTVHEHISTYYTYFRHVLNHQRKVAFFFFFNELMLFSEFHLQSMCDIYSPNESKGISWAETKRISWAETMKFLNMSLLVLLSWGSLFIVILQAPWLSCYISRKAVKWHGISLH